MPSLMYSQRAYPIWKTNFGDTYEVVDEGSFGQLRKCVRRHNGQEFAVKTVTKDAKRPGMTFAKACNEIKMLQRVHANSGVAHLVDYFDDADEMNIVLELCRGGDMYTFVSVSFFG